MDFFGDLGAAWAWLAAGLTLAALELAVPGVYLIWLAVAAIATGALTFVLDWGTTYQVINFVFLALIAAYSAKRFLRDRPIESSNPMLNNRGGSMIGQSAVVVQAIEGGEGRVKLGDSEWIGRGEDCAVGTRVVITATKGPILTVEPVAVDVTPALEAGESGKPA